MRKLIVWLHRLSPKSGDLKGTFLHRTFGERLFDRKIWKPSRRGITLGLSIGIFVALTPTVGIQMLLAGAAAIYWRANVPTALAACWITNPFTIPIIFTLQFKLGMILTDVPGSEIVIKEAGVKQVVGVIKPLWIGSLFSGAMTSLLTYIITNGIWEIFARDRD